MAGTNFYTQVTSTLWSAFTDESGLITVGKCLGAPPTTAGLFAHGAQLIRSDSGTGNKALYENVGSTASPSWNLLGDVTAGEISLAEGNLLIGNASGVAAALNAKTANQILVGNGTTLTSAPVSGDLTNVAGAFTVANNAITSAKIATSVAGNGLSGGGGSPLSTGVLIYNNTGAPLTKGTLVTVGSYNGTNGVTIAVADLNTGPQATHVVTADIADTTTGMVYPYAVVTGLNTNGLTIGDFVYLSTAGNRTFTPPTGAGQIKQTVGAIKVVDVANGEIVFFPGEGLVDAIGTEQLQNGSVTNPIVADTTGAAGLAIAKTALVVYDFAVDGGAQGAITLANAPTIPDNAVVWVESYEVVTTLTSATDAATVTLQLPVDGAILVAQAISAGGNVWDQGVYTETLGPQPSPKKLTAARVPQLLVAGGENLTAGKIIFQLRYWVSI